MKKLQFSYGKYSKRIRLNNYPFFNIEIYKDDRAIKNKYSHDYSYEKFENKKDCWIDLLSEVKKRCNKYLTGNKEVFKMQHTGFCNNTGAGKYINKRLWMNYQWVEGSNYVTSYVSKSYAIRFCKSVPYDEIVQFHDKIINRHCKKFIANFEKLANTRIKFSGEKTT